MLFADNVELMNLPSGRTLALKIIWVIMIVNLSESTEFNEIKTSLFPNTLLLKVSLLKLILLSAVASGDYAKFRKVTVD